MRVYNVASYLVYARNNYVSPRHASETYIFISIRQSSDTIATFLVEIQRPTTLTYIFLSNTRINR